MCSSIKLDNSIEEREYKTYIKNWFSGFKNIVTDILESEKRLYIIAISRKMPRFFSWLRKREAYYGVEGLGAILDKAEYTTEHALPFIFNDKATDDYEVIVVDDSMVYGNTMRRVSNDVFLYSGGKLPYISIIVACYDVFLGLIKHNVCHIPNTASDRQVSKWMDYVSKCNAASELPVDVEFPIIHLNKISKNSYIQQVFSTVPPSEWYELKKPNTLESVNVILDKEVLELSAMDFSKSRCFFAENETRIVVISPLAIQYDSVYGGSHFSTQKLKSVWEIIKGSAVAKNSESTLRSLVVIINYLHSINTLKRNWNSIIPDTCAWFKLEISDLMLLVGKRLACSIQEDLMEYLLSEEQEVYMIIRTGLPQISVPTELENSYLIQRNLISARHKKRGNVEELLGELFDQSRFDQSVLGQNITLFHRMHSSFLESFDSLREFVRYAFDVEKLDKEINKSVDSLIDAGRIVPRYVPVINSSGEQYWRRYFTSAHSSVEL